MISGYDFPVCNFFFYEPSLEGMGLHVELAL